MLCIILDSYFGFLLKLESHNLIVFFFKYLETFAHLELRLITISTYRTPIFFLSLYFVVSPLPLKHILGKLFFSCFLDNKTKA